jgi:acetylornithine deacetylase
LELFDYFCINMEMDIIAQAEQLLEGLISIPSVSRNELEAADYLQQAMVSYGMSTQRVGNNIFCLSANYDDDKPTILLNAHIDTVKPVAGWTKNPYEPTLEDGKLYGLGSNDDGGSLVSLLSAFRMLWQTKQDYNLIFLASCEEEVSGKNGIELALKELPSIDVALVGEPTGMQPAIAEKGLMVLDVSTCGKAGHAARNEGVNAIYKAIEDIQWFENYKFSKESPLLGAVKMTVTQINAGTQHNVIPDLCTFVVDIRSNECYSNEELFDEITEHIASTAKARSYRLNSSIIDLHHPFVERLLEMGKKPFGSPTLSDQALMHFPSFKMGPGQSSRSHSADEFIKLDEIRDAISTYYSVLNGLKLR